MTIRADAASEVGTPTPSAPTPHDEVLRVADGALTVAAREGVTIASEADRVVLTAATEIVLQVGQSTFTLRADGTILLNGRRMSLVAPAMIDINPEPAPGSAGGAP
ncbi:MAG TPA: hypothetical protein VGD56_08935 [Gemmatirosa sp.]